MKFLENGIVGIFREEIETESETSKYWKMTIFSRKLIIHNQLKINTAGVSHIEMVFSDHFDMRHPACLCINYLDMCALHKFYLCYLLLHFSMDFLKLS